MMELALRFTHAAAHMLWVGALIALAAFAVERLLARTAAGRHAVHLCGLMLTVLALPVAFFVAPVKVSRSVPLPVEISNNTTIAPAPASAEQVATAEMIAPGDREKSLKAGDGARVESPFPLIADTPGASWEKAAPWVAGAYLVGLLGMVLRLGYGFVGSARLRRRGDPVGTGVWTESLRRMGERVKVRVHPALKWSREVAAPVVIGFVKPVILLPVALASRLSPAQVEAVLAHELAHLRRRDTWALAVQRVVETALFFHPAVWWMSHRMDAAREEACDDLVLAAGCNPADYAEALVVCSECRLERISISAHRASPLAATGKGGELLRRRVLRLIGGGDDGAVRLGRTGWVLGLLLVGGMVMAMFASHTGRADLADFDFNNPPSSYEKGIKAADRNHRIKVAGLQFAASPLQWNKEGWLRLPKVEQGPGEELFLNLGVSGGYEVVEIRLFDHDTREFIHSSAMQHPGYHQKNLFVERIGSSNWLRMKEVDGTFPDAMDVWLRLATEGSGHTFVLPAKFGASASHDGSEVVVTTLLAGAMNGKSGPTGEMEWDLATVHDEDRALTVNIENRGKPLDGRYHLVAVNKDGSRHPMDDTHFRDFRRMGPRVYFRMDVALADVDHFELVPFKDRHKFFFNGLKVPWNEPAEVSNLSAAVADQVMRLIQSRRLPFVTEERLRQIGAEFADLVNEHQRDDLSDDRKRAILAGVKANGRSLNQAYLEFPDWTKTLKWQVFMAITRAPLSESDQGRMANQRNWMRGIIAGLPEERFRSRNEVLKELEARFTDPLCTPLDRPMTEAQFARFQKAITTFLREAQTGVNERTPTVSRSVKPHNPLPSLIHRFVFESLWAQYQGETHEYLYPLFDNDRIGGSGAANGHVTLHFMSNRPFLGDSRALRRMEEQFCVVDAMNGHPVVAPSDQRDPAKFAAWLKTQNAGDFGLSRTAGDSLVAVRGAKLALLNVENWIQADAIHDEALREIIERQNQEQIELTSYHKSWQGAMSGFNGPYVGILTKESRLAVVHVEDFTGPEEIMYRVRARPSNEASAALPAVVAR